MIETPSPISWEGLKALGPVIAIAVLGGVVAFIRKVRAGQVRPFNVTELIGELVTSGFAGVLAYWLCHSWIGNAYLEAAIIGMAGHMGSRAIFVMETWLEKRLDGVNPFSK